MGTCRFPACKSWLAIVVAISCLTTLVSLVPGSWASRDETSALLEFFEGVRGAEKIGGGGGCLASTWSLTNAGEGCPSSFCGVTCGVDGNVVGVQLAGQGLKGSVRPNTLANLHQLAILDLSHNQLSGSLPDDLGTLESLRILDLSHNSFSGAIPSSFEGLSNLLNLSLAANGLNQSIPSSLGALHHLVYLNLSYNSLQEGIPLEMAEMMSLRVLDLHSNQLSGGLDPVLLGLSSLAAVDLSDNNLSGFLPWQPNDTLPVLRTLQYVNLSHNQFAGPLAPTRFASIFAEKLQVLDMSHNQLSGNLPDFEFEIGLVTLRLSHNLFTGAVPSTLLSTNLGLLEELDLSSNNLTGGIVRVLSTSLVALNVSYNSLSGMIPQKIGSCSIVDLSYNNLSGNLSYLQYWSDRLEFLDLSFNHLSGELMDEVPRFVRLQSLRVSHNSLVGAIPLDYGFFPKLLDVDLSFNHLSGPIPASFFNSSSLSLLILSNNELSGSIPLPSMLSLKSAMSYPYASLDLPLQLGRASQIVFMDLSNNKLSGSVSEGIGNLQNLEMLNLSNNAISGSMPVALCNLTNLQELDFSGNLLTGSIPNALPSSLSVLVLSNNNLSGIIPENLQRFWESSFFPGNGGLVPGWALSSPKGPLGSSQSRGGKHGAVKAGLIGGCTVGLLLIVVIALFMYFRSPSLATVYGNSSQIGSKDNANDSQNLQKCAPCGALLSFRGSHTSDAHPGTSSGKVLLADQVIKPSTQVQAQAHLEGRSSWEQGTIKADPDSRIMALSPSRSIRAFSPEFGMAEELLRVETPIVLKVQSPDRLAGDLHFLDKSFIQCSAEELSRAPAEVLGRSSHGTTYKATLDNGHVLTVKWLREGLAKSKKEFSREAKKFAKIRHPNLNPMRGYYWGPQEHEKLILSDFVSSGSLAARLADKTGLRHAPLSWQQRLVVAVDVARGLSYLHDDRHLPHGNLKATNVLIDGSSHLSARLTDYSLHVLMTPQGTANQILNAGALGYRAPELATAKRPKPTTKGDVYAYGVLILELLSGRGAGDIVSGQSEAVDLTDWVRLQANEKRAFECLDPLLRMESAPHGMEQVVGLALRCISTQGSQRPSMSVIYEEIASLSATVAQAL
ncbi:hypothetical protein GOP47_0015811 [Adiantum capillus-veneris]|uniref:Protein kinase domain-containing protein n=1 Tax=Adiantum capillus-veneris TaxID=13818 RepID=A0A9D4UKE4_ADICA|nr:hypothetical protein GOP47_0015811 [Adiantum capillus-veneris]